MSYELIETVEVGAGGASSIEFTSIPQDGTDLVCVVSGRSSTAGNQIDLIFNNDTGANYDYLSLRGNGSTASSSSTTGDTHSVIGISPTSGNTANTFGSTTFYISNYTSSTDKSISSDSVSENNGSAANQWISAVLYNTTNAITSLKMSHFDKFEQYSTASLYKVTA